MKYYKEDQNNVYAYENDGSQDYLIGNKIEMTEEEIRLHINPPKTQAEVEEELKAHFKGLYLSVFHAKLKELDYDGIDTLTLWANKIGSPFQTEAQTILNWYEAIIIKNYEILNDIKAGKLPLPTDEEYLALIPTLGGV